MTGKGPFDDIAVTPDDDAGAFHARRYDRVQAPREEGSAVKRDEHLQATVGHGRLIRIEDHVGRGLPHPRSPAGREDDGGHGVAMPTVARRTFAHARTRTTEANTLTTASATPINGRP